MFKMINSFYPWGIFLFFIHKNRLLAIRGVIIVPLNPQLESNFSQDNQVKEAIIMINNTLSFINSEETLKINELTFTESDSIIKFLNKCAGFNFKTPEEQQQLDRIVNIARAKGKSLKELKQALAINKKKLKKALKLWEEFDENPSMIEKTTQAFKLVAEVVTDNWDFYSEDSCNCLKEWGDKINNYLDSTDARKFEELEVEAIQENLKAHQLLVNAIFGAVECVNIKTDLGRKLLSIRQEMILSGEPLVTLAEFDDYLDNAEEKEFVI